MRAIKTIIHDLAGYRLQPVDVARGDRGSRVVQCRLTLNGVPWEVPEGARVQVAYTLPDGTPGLYDQLPDGTPAGTIDGSTVELLISDELTAQAGAADVSGVILGPGGEQLATWPMRLNVVGPAVLSNPEQWPQLGGSYEGQLLYVAGGIARPLQLGPGLSIRDGVLYVTGCAGSEEPVGTVTTEVVDGDFRVYLDGIEIQPVVDEAGGMTWPGLTLTIDSDGNATLQKEE